MDFENIIKKELFSYFREGKNKFHHFWLPYKTFGKPPSAPLEKILPTPMLVL